MIGLTGSCGQNLGKMRRPQWAKPVLDFLRIPLDSLFRVTVIAGVGGAVCDAEIGPRNTEAVIASVIITHIESSGHMAINTLGSRGLSCICWLICCHVGAVMMMLWCIELLAAVAADAQLIALGF